MKNDKNQWKELVIPIDEAAVLSEINVDHLFSP